MRNDVVDLDLVRKELKAGDDNTKLGPVDLLRLLIRDIESGKVNATAILCIVSEDPMDGTYLNKKWSYRCGLSRERELTLITLHQAEFLNDHMNMHRESDG